MQNCTLLSLSSLLLLKNKKQIKNKIKLFIVITADHEIESEAGLPVLHIPTWFGIFFLFFAVPSSLPTSEALLPRRSSRHPPSSATPKAHSASLPRPPEVHRKWRQIVGRLPSEGNTTACWVTSVVFSSACSDSTYAGHHLLCPLLTTMLAKSRSQTEWASPPESRPPLRPSTNPPMWTLWVCGLWSELSQARKEEGTPRLRPPRECSMKGYRSWYFFYSIYAVIDENEDDNWWCYESPFRFWDYLTGPQPTLTVIIIPVLTRPGNCGTCSVGQVIRATPSKTHPWSGWNSAVWFQPSHWASSTPSSG